MRVSCALRSLVLSCGLATAVAGSLMAADPAASAAVANAGKPAHISKGAEVKLTDHLVAGKTVIFDFYSDYCPPCVAIAPELEKLHAKRADVVVVKVDINRPGIKGIDWKSPVAQQYNLRSIPHFKVYGPDGKLVAEDSPTNSAARKIVVGMFE
jgi:thiol-disulfide isomerase/thioredoxin